MGAEWIVDVLAGHKDVSGSELHLKCGYTKSVCVSYSLPAGTSLTCWHRVHSAVHRYLQDSSRVILDRT